MAEETAFFRFDTNAEQIAGDIRDAMSSINRSLSEPLKLSTGQLAADTAGMEQSFRRLYSELEAGKGRLTNLVGQLGSGLIDRPTFDRQMKESIGGTVGRIPQILADTLANAPTATATRAPVQAIARQVANDYVSTLLGEVRDNRDLAGGLLKGVRFDPRQFRSSVQGVAENPVAYGSETTRMAELINRLRAENLVAKDLYGVNSKQENASGFGRLTGPIRENQIEFGENGDTFTPTPGLVEELRELVRLEREAEQTGNRLARSHDQQARAAAELAAAEKLLGDSQTKRVGGRLLLPDGSVYKPGGAGAVQETNRLRVQDTHDAAAKMQTEAANASRLLENWAQVVPVQQYHTLGDEVYKISRYGAELVDNAVVEKRVLEQKAVIQDAELKRAQRLNELDGKRALRAEQNNSGALGGFLGRFHRGEQTVLTGLGGQIASAASFSLAYGSLFALQHAMRDTLKEFLDYQDSVTDLEVATRGADIVTAGWVNSLSELSRVAGSNVGEAMDTAARGVRAFTSVGDSPDAVRAAGDATTASATKLSLIANKSLPDATGDVIASATAFGLAPDQIEQVVDAVANAKAHVGGDAAQISQGLSLLALSAQEAGFDLNQAAAVMGLVQARTDQSGQAIATRLTRIFQIVSGSTGKALAQELGVDSTQSVKGQLEDFATIYADPNTSEGVKDRISSSLGGTANLRELLPLLTENETLQTAYAEALSNSGQATAEFNRKSDNLVGTLKKISGDVSNLQVALSRSGLFDFVGIGLKAVEPMLHGLSLIVEKYDELTEHIPGLQTLVGTLLALAAATKAVGVVTAANAMFTGGLSALLGGVAEGGAVAEGVAAVEGHGSPAETAAGHGEAVGKIESLTQRSEQVVYNTEAAEKLEHGISKRAGEEEAGAKATVVAREAEVAGIEGATEARLAAEARATAGINAATVAKGEAAAGGIAADVAGDAALAGGAAVAAEKKAVKAGSMRAGLGTMVGAVAGNPYVLAAAVAVGVGLYAYGKHEERKQAEEGLRSSFGEGFEAYSRAREGGNAAAFQQAAHDWMSQAGEINKTHGPGQFEDRQNALFEGSLNNTRFLNYIGERVRQEQELAYATKTMNAFGTGAIETVNQLADGMQAIQDGGGTALTALRAMRRALETTPEEGTEVWAPEALKANILAGVGESLPDALANKDIAVNEDGSLVDKDAPPVRIVGGKGGAYIPPPKPTITDPRDLAALINLNGIREDLYSALDAEIQSEGLDPSKGITEEQKKKLVEAAVNKVDLSQYGDLADEVRADWIKAAEEAIGGFGSKAGAPKELYNASSLSPDQIKTLLNGSPGSEDAAGFEGLLASMQNGLAAIPADDDGTILESELGKNVRLLQMLKRKNTGEAIPQLEKALRDAEHQYRQVAVENAEDLRAAAESRATSTGQLRAIRMKYARISFRAAGNDRVLIEQLMESMDRATVKSIIDSAETALSAARAAYRSAQNTVGIAASVVTEMINGLPVRHGGGGTPGGQEKDKAQRRLNRAKNYLETLKDAYEASAITEEKAQYDGGDSKEPEHTRAEMVAAKAQAHAARLGGGIAAARASLTSAAAAMKEAKKGSVEWFQALGDFYSAQWAMRDAIEQYHSTLYQLRGDITDPVENARDTLRAAREKLRRDRENGAGRDVVAADRLDVRQSETSLQQTRWQQKLSDMQTAEQLGRISEAQYMRYLEREHDRLTKIHHRTRQQQDQLNTIDGALQQANSAMDAMFNFGSINTRGIVYQARRFAAERRADHAAMGAAHASREAESRGQEVRIYIDGADTAKVRRIVEDTIGGASRTRTTQSRRR